MAKSFTTDVTIGEKVYKFKSLTLDGFGEFQDWCSKKLRVETKELCNSLGEDISREELQEIKASDTYVDTEMKTVKGMIHSLYIIFKNNNVDVDEKYIKQNLTLEQIVELAEEAVAELKEENVKGKKTQPKNQKAKSQKKK